MSITETWENTNCDNCVKTWPCELRDMELILEIETKRLQ